MMAKTKALRQKHPRFIYENFRAQKSGKNLKIAFEFKIDPGINFSPEITIFDIHHSQINSLDSKILNNLVFHLGLMEIPSYWKTTCSPKIIIKPGFLNPEQVGWWKNLLLKGMGEFFYTNKTRFTQPDFVSLKVNPQAPKWDRYEKTLPQNKFLVLIGGGKDSAVTLETLKNQGGVGSLILNPREASLAITKLFKPFQTIIVKREIDPVLLKLNQRGYLNGHTPFSAYLAFLSSMMGVLFNFGSIVVANERSAEEKNLTYLGRKINHQYSKTFQFEKLFRQYSQKHLAKTLSYFSLSRPLWELQISKLFASYPQFFPLFRSCNRGEKTNIWCKQCPKCLSTFVLLYPFLKREEVAKIFGENLFDNASLLPLLKSLIGKSGHKPFECVATQEEIQVALYLSLQKAQKENHLPFLLRFFQKKILSEEKDWEKATRKILAGWSSQHFVPRKLAKILREKTKV